MRKLIPKSECKDRIKSKKRLKTQTVIPGRPEMTVKDQLFLLIIKGLSFCYLSIFIKTLFLLRKYMS